MALLQRSTTTGEREWLTLPNFAIKQIELTLTTKDALTFRMVVGRSTLQTLWK